MLAWLWLIGLAAATGYDTGGRPEVAHAAQAALAALNDVQRLEQQILEDERRRITADVGPLETYSFLHQSLGLLFDTALTAIRHAMAASPQKTVLVEAASLEKQLTEMLLAHAKEPLFFWHGPKWMVKSKLDRLLARGAWHDEMKALANFSFTITDLLGKGATAEEGQKAVQGSVPLVGVVVDDSFCSPGAPCSLDGLKPLATEATHVLVLPCPEATLGQVGKALRSASVSIYLSVSLPGELLEAAPREATPAAIAELLDGYISQAEKALGKPIDLVWMPYAAFKKQYWAGTKTLLEKQHRWAYGIQAEVTLPTVAKRLLERTPAPKAWLTTDDLLRPAPQEAVQAALDAGITCVSLPRKQAFSDFAALYFKMAGLTEATALAHLRWAQHRGLASVLPLEQIVASSGSQGGALVYWKLLQAPAHSVDQSQLKLYDAENGYPLKAALYEARLALKSGEGKLSTSPPEKEPTVFTPGVSEKILTGLKEQAKVFKANDHIIYAEDFFDTATFAAIKEETQRLWRSEDIEANCNLDGTNRLGGYITDLLPHNSSLYHLIYGNDPFRHWVSAVNDEGPMWPSDFPIELREYGSQSKGMGCHPDLQMYKVPRKDLEFAFTVDNDSRCNVSFWDAAGKLHLVQTKPNSLMMVGVNAATHCVSSTEGGTRSILKFIYVGDYRKSDEFWHYTSNECDDSNPNRQMLSDRRAQRQREARSSSSEL